VKRLPTGLPWLRRLRRRKLPLLAAAFLLAVIPILIAEERRDWRTADRSSAGIAPRPEDEPRAVVQVYAARAFGWRGFFSVHCWIATKERDADHFRTFHVTGFGLRRRGATVEIKSDIPDRRWYDAEPYIIQDLRGEKAAAAIPKIERAAAAYPYPATYRAWPGPNSNTFTSFIIRHVPELGVELPPNAIGKDWLGPGKIFSRSESGTGFQASLFALLGVTVGLGEGIEANLLGLTLGLDLWRPALKLPLIGRVGFPDAPLFD